MHLMTRLDEPCALPDEHRGHSPCRTRQGLENYRASQARYMAEHPVERALTVIRYEAGRRGRR